MTNLDGGEQAHLPGSYHKTLNEEFSKTQQPTQLCANWFAIPLISLSSTWTAQHLAGSPDTAQPNSQLPEFGSAAAVTIRHLVHMWACPPSC